MDKLLKIMQELREKCPWDQQQTPMSLTKYAIEEAYEVEAAIRHGDINEIRNELGDLLLQVVFQSQMFSEQGAFNFQDVVEAISEKLIRRHPYVFQADQFNNLSPEQVSELWKQIKQQEKQGKPQSRLDEIKHGPALLQAQEIQTNVAKVGFDFETVEDAYEKLEEELDEFKQALKNQNIDEIQDEFGDCLFSLVNVGRKLAISSETSLLSTIHKFRSRFAFIEDQAQKQQRTLEDMTLSEMDELWNQAKRQLKLGEKHMQFSMNLWKNKHNIFIILFWSVISSTFVQAQSFDQNFKEWKAKQQMYDQKLSMQQASHSNSPKSSVMTDSSGQIHLNQANIDELQKLKGIGEKKAQAIVEYRQKNGGFKNIDEFKNVKGIGPAIFEKNKTRLTL